MLETYIVTTVGTLIVAATIAALHYDTPGTEYAARKAALIVITCWAWPIWAIILIVNLARYALEPYMNKED